jgi:ABC-type glycerol-3-phosphate transport system substrate-binding protein
MIKKSTFNCILWGLIILLNACNSSNHGKLTEKNNSKKDDVTNSTQINISWLAPWYGEGKKETLMREIGREFAFLNQDINLKVSFTNDAYPKVHWFTGVEEGLDKMISTNEWPYDVLICERSHYQRISDKLNDPNWANKYFVDFSKEDWFKNAHTDGIINNQSIIKAYGGIVPGPMLEGMVYILFVSDEVEKKLGIKVKQLDMQLSDFQSYAEAVYRYNQSHDEKITFFSTQDASAPSRLFKQLALSEYGKEYFSSKEESLNTLGKVLNGFEELAKYKPLEQYTLVTGKDVNEVQQQLKQDKFLFIMQPSWIYLLWETTNPNGTKAMRPCEMPTMGNKKAPLYEGNFQTIFAVPKNGKHVEAAKKLIKYITSTDVAEKWVNNSKCPTGLKTKIASSEFGQEGFDLFYRQLSEKYGLKLRDIDLYSILLNQTPGYAYSEPTFNQDFSHIDVLTGKVSANEALSKIRKRF